MTKLTKQEQAEALAKTCRPYLWDPYHADEFAYMIERGSNVASMVWFVERLHARGFEIVRKEQEDG